MCFEARIEKREKIGEEREEKRRRERKGEERRGEKECVCVFSGK